MSVSAKLLQTVRDALRANPPPGVKTTEISVLPEGKVPAIMGQRWLTVHGTKIEGLTPRKSIRKRMMLFGVSLSQRVRDIPNDRFGEIAYLESLSMTEALDEIISAVQGLNMDEVRAEVAKQLEEAKNQSPS